MRLRVLTRSCCNGGCLVPTAAARSIAAFRGGTSPAFSSRTIPSSAWLTSRHAAAPRLPRTLRRTPSATPCRPRRAVLAPCGRRGLAAPRHIHAAKSHTDERATLPCARRRSTGRSRRASTRATTTTTPTPSGDALLSASPALAKDGPSPTPRARPSRAHTPVTRPPRRRSNGTFGELHVHMYHGSGVDGMQSMLPATVYTNSKPRPSAVPAGGPYVVNGSSTGWVNWQARGSWERRAGVGMWCELESGRAARLGRAPTPRAEGAPAWCRCRAYRSLRAPPYRLR